MARRRAGGTPSSRELLLGAANELFSGCGLDQTTTRGIGKRAKVARW
ncbi:TetR family transcriptional regulator [Streptomyces sp. NPDC001156]